MSEEADEQEAVGETVLLLLVEVRRRDTRKVVMVEVVLSFLFWSIVLSFSDVIDDDSFMPCRLNRRVMKSQLL